MTIRPRPAAALLAAVSVLALSLTACSASPDDDGPGADVLAQGETDAALEEGGELLVWAWTTTVKDAVDAFEAEYPNVEVTLANVGTGNDHYVALQNAIAAGSGVPDVAQLEYPAVPQFAISGALAGLSQFGADDLSRAFSPGPWDAVTGTGTGGDAVYGLPMDSGPMALFYNARVFDEAGVDVPATWDEYLTTAQEIHAHDPDTYITADNGISSFTTSMIWQAGGHPFQVDGTNVTVDLADPGTARFAQMWQPLIDQGLVADIPDWSDQWFQGLADGTIATLVTGAWMQQNFQTGAPGGAGEWRVAPMPQWTEGGNQTAENGGSSLAVTEASHKKVLAYAFLKYVTVGDGVQARLDGGAFPATMRDLTDPDFLDRQPKYFGGQKINQVLADSATNVVDGWQYLPYQVYANSIFADTVGQAYTGATTLTDGLTAWQDSIVEYGTEQGFTVNQ